MRYLFYFFTLTLVFTAGMLVGNFYIPENNTSYAATISLPPLDITNPALQSISEQDAQQALLSLTQALSACPLVAEQEKDFLFNRISLYLTLTDFRAKQAAYEAEIAKNIEGTRQTAQFTRAAADYQAAKARTEQRADELFPSVAPPDKPTAPSTTTATTTVLPSVPTSQEH